MKPLKIVLGDLAYFNKYATNRLFVPLNIGYVATYSKQLFDQDIEIYIFKNADRLLRNVRENRPDILGLSLYYWNTSLDYAVVKKVRQMYGNGVVIVYGGPSIDTDISEQKKLFVRFPEVDAFIPNEGEIGFSNIIRSMLSNRKIGNSPLDGVVFLKEKESSEPVLIKGNQAGLSINLATVDSPYLTGVLEPFLKGDFQLLIQTTRLCPYQCTYCVSGKNKGQLRKFPIEQVKEEITYIAKAYKNRPYFTLHLCDDNFGIFPRDIKIAEHFAKCSKDIGYPKKMEFYSNKKFSNRSKCILEKLGKINFLGVPVSLQSSNPATLTAIKRRNLSQTEINFALEWASDRDLLTSTELIFGLPFETRESFLELLETCVERGFDLIQCYNLILVDGSELNRCSNRKKYKMRTMFRIPSSYYGIIADEFVSESEEIVVSTDSFSFDDYISIRCINFMFHAVFALNYYKSFFQYVRQLRIPVVKFLEAFMNPDLTQEWPEEYVRFVIELKRKYSLELCSSKEELTHITNQKYKDNGNEVAKPTRLNLYFAARLIYMEKSWMNDVLKRHLKQFVSWEESAEIKDLVDFILRICDLEWIRFPDICIPDPVPVKYNILSFRSRKFQDSLSNLRFKERDLKFSIEPETENRITLFHQKFSQLFEEAKYDEYYYGAMDFIFPRSKLMYEMSY